MSKLGELTFMRIRTNVFYSALLTCSNYIFQLITYPYISRVLGVEKIGMCNFAMNYVQYALLISGMGISILGVREIARVQNDRRQLNQVFSTLFFIHAITTGIILVIYIASFFLLPSLNKYKEILQIGIMQIIANLFLVEWFFKGIENFRYITLRNLFVRVIYVVCVFVFVRDENDYLIYFALLVGIIVVNGIINWKYRMNFVKISFANISIKKYILSFFILGIYLLLTSMYTTFNVLYLGFVKGDVEVGYYTTAHKLYTVILGLFTAFTGVMMPRMSSLVQNRDYKAIYHLGQLSFKLLFAFSLPLIFFCLIFAPQLIYFLAGSGYEGAILPMRIIIPLVLLIGMEQILIIQLLMPLKLDRAVFINSLWGAITAIVINVLLVSRYGSVGSSWVWVCSEVVVFISAYYYIRQDKQLCRIVPWLDLLKNTILMCPLLIFYVLCSYMKYNSFGELCVVVLISAAYVLFVQYKVLKNELLIKLLNRKSI